MTVKVYNSNKHEALQLYCGMVNLAGVEHHVVTKIEGLVKYG